MKKATTLDEIQKNFNPTPLVGDELDEKTGIYVDTIEARTGNEAKSPLRKLYNDCTGDSANFIHVLVGHQGCGKSTEINKLHEKFLTDGYVVRKIDCQKETNLFNISVSDILFLIMNALLEIANENSIPVSENNLKILNDFFDEKETVTQIKPDNGAEVNSNFEISLPAIVKISFGLKKQIINKAGTITTIRHRIVNNFSTWIACLNDLIDNVYFKLNQRPVIIFENLDKIVPVTNALKMFEEGYISSENIRTYCIFTFPVSLTYSPSIGRIEKFFEKHVFPMIDVKTKEGKNNQIGINAIKKIIGKRADLNLFENKALDLLIEKTGGSLRDIFWCIKDAADYADYKQEGKVKEKHIISSLTSFKSDITRRIVTGDYPALKKIHTEKTEIEDREKMLEYLESHVVLEYNCERWHDCHPLIWDFIDGKI